MHSEHQEKKGRGFLDNSDNGYSPDDDDGESKSSMDETDTILQTAESL